MVIDNFNIYISLEVKHETFCFLPFLFINQHVFNVSKKKYLKPLEVNLFDDQVFFFFWNKNLGHWEANSYH